MKTNLLLLFDYNNLACRCAHVSQNSPELLPYMIFKAMREFVEDVADILDAGDTIDVVLALDSRDGYWRREIYPPYKADRQEKRKDDGFDWEAAFSEFDILSESISKYTPWRVIRESKCEADDVIYTLAVNHKGPVVIHSGDSDYLQLVSDNISLYLPHLQEYAEFPRYCKVSGKDVLCKTPDEYLRYAILTGQGGKDNVYNVKTPTNFEGGRKPGFGAVAAGKVMAAADFDAELTKLGLYSNYLRNRTLIDMTKLPEAYANKILETYARYELNHPDMRGLLSIYDWPSLSRDIDQLNEWLLSLQDGIVKRSDDIEEMSVSVNDIMEDLEFQI